MTEVDGREAMAIEWGHGCLLESWGQTFGMACFIEIRFVLG